MRRSLAAALVLALVLGLGGCLNRTEAGWDVYYVSQAAGEGAALVPEKRTLPQESDPVEGLLTLVLSPPQGEDLVNVIPEVVTLRQWTLENGLLTVDFSGSYGILSGIELTLADYCVVLTLTQLEEVDAVVITADGEPIPYRDHQRLTAADLWSLQIEEDQEDQGETEETS